jgi:hypothetical protein
VITVDRDETIATWRRAEAKVYPAVMVNEALYRQYVALVRAIADELTDIDDEDDLVTAWRERHEVVLEAVARLAPSMRPLMDLEAVRAAAFCQRHREVTREHGKRIARDRLGEARRTGAEWVVLFDDVTPFGSHHLEMHVPSGRAVHSSSELGLDAPAPKYELEVVQLDPATGAWLVDRPPLMPAVQYPTLEEWEIRIRQAKETFGKRG